MFLLAEMELMFWQNSTLLMKMSAWRKKTVDRIHTKGLTPPSLKLPSKLKLRNAPYAWDKTFTHQPNSPHFSPILRDYVDIVWGDKNNVEVMSFFVNFAE